MVRPLDFDVVGRSSGAFAGIFAAAIYKFHPDFAGKVNVWWGDPTDDHGPATLEGGDVMPIGKGNVLIAMCEHTSRQAISQLAAALFKKDAAERMVDVAMPKLGAAMQLYTVFTFAARDCVLLYPGIVCGITAFSYRSSDEPSGIDLHKEKSPLLRSPRNRSGSRRCASLRLAATRICASGRSGTAAPTRKWLYVK